MSIFTVICNSGSLVVYACTCFLKQYLCVCVRVNMNWSFSALQCEFLLAAMHQGMS